MNVKHEELTVRALYDLSYTAAPLLEACTYPWEALPKIGEFIKALGKTLPPEEYEQRGEDVWVAKSAKLYPNVYIAGPTIIGRRPRCARRIYPRQRAHRRRLRRRQFHRGEKRHPVRRRAGPALYYIGDSVMGHKAHPARVPSRRT